MGLRNRATSAKSHTADTPEPFDGGTVVEDLSDEVVEVPKKRRGRRKKAAEPLPEASTGAEVGDPPGESEKAPDKAAERRSKLRSRRVDPAVIKDAYARAATSGGSPFLSLSSGKNVVRLLGPKDPDVDPIPFLATRIHRLSGGRDAIDLDWLFADPARIKRALDSGKVSEYDVRQWQRYGRDPFNAAATRAKDRGMSGKDSGWPYLFSSAKYFYNAALRNDDGTLGAPKLLCFGKEKQDQLQALYEDFDVFDEGEDGYDFKLVGNGQNGMQRRYSLMPVPSPCPAGDFSVGAMKDFWKDVVLYRVMGWDAKVMALFAHADFMAALGLTPASFGVVVSSAQVPDDEDEE